VKEEPTVVINRITLTAGQAMALRVAVSDFFAQMSEPNALGDDEHGQAMANAYRAQLALILRLMSGGQD
jgi:hypothetical protein